MNNFISKIPNQHINQDARNWYKFETSDNALHIKGNKIYTYEYCQWIEDKLQLLIQSIKDNNDINSELETLFKYFEIQE